MTRDKIQLTSATINVYKELIKIEKALNGVDTNHLNQGWTLRYSNKVSSLYREADQLAQVLGLRAYHQQDPRGCSLYLVKSLKNAEIRYTNGIAII